jgi:hypothetical protein
MLIEMVGRLESWQRVVENYTVGLMIVVIQLERAKREARRSAR